MIEVDVLDALAVIALSISAAFALSLATLTVASFLTIRRFP